jgi:hypothetical protein
MYRLRFGIAILIAMFMTTNPALARGIYQQPDVFLQETFPEGVPDPEVVWLTKSIRPAVEDILAHKPTALRIRYWRKQDRTAWILEEIGKEKPITTGVVINKGTLEKIKVLVFRESRGWEVRHDFFTDQFKGASLKQDHYLSQSIDGISGATLSVRALQKQARLALYLHQTQLSTP